MSAARLAATPAAGGLTIRARILLLALAVLLPGALVLVWRLGGEIQQSREDAVLTVSLLRDDTMSQVSRVLRHASALLDYVAQEPQLQSGDAGTCRAAAQAIPLLTPGFLRVEVRTPDGTLLCWSSHDAPAATTGSRAQASPSSAMGRMHLDPPTGRPVVAMSRMLPSPAGIRPSELRLLLDLGSMSDELARDSADGAIVTVVDQDLTILMRTRQGAEFIGKKTTIADPTHSGNAGFVDSAGRDGIDRLYAYGSIPETGWRVFAGLPRDQVYAGYEQARQRTILVGLLVLLFACALAWKLASVIARPIAALQAAVRRVATGDLAGHVEVGGPPEMQRVAEDFNRMVDALALSRSRLQALFDTMSEAVVTVDDAQTVVMANPAAATLLRCTTSVLIGSKLDRWIPAGARDAHRLDVERFGSSGSGPRDMGHRPEITALCFDGEETPIEASISMVEHEGRRLYMAVLRDVNERRKAMVALERSKALLTAALENMSDAVMIVDAQGRLIAHNAALASFYRLPDGSVPPADVHELAALFEVRMEDGRVAQPQECACLLAIRGEAGTGLLHRLRRLDGGPSWVGSFNFAPIRNAQGVLSGAVVTARDVTAALEAKRELERSRDALRRLVGSLDRSIDDERKRISRELHDDLQQTLAAIGMESSTALRVTPEPRRALHDALQRIESLSHGALRSTRRIIADLRPQLLEELGLAAALCHMADVHARRYRMGCDVEVDDDFDTSALPELVATCLYRVAQEALHNIARHAGATHVHVRLRMMDGHAVRLEIQDDGRGLETDVDDKPRGFGLLGMAERVHALAGSLRVWSPPGDGTVVDAQLPLDLGVQDDAADAAQPPSS